MTQLILLGCLGCSAYLIRRDSRDRLGVSLAVWIPTLWAGILLSRFVSLWFGSGGGLDSLEGSPVDRLFFLGAIIASMLTLASRKVDWPSVVVRNWSIVLFYGYLLLSVLWAEPPVVSFKRWFKDLGNVFVALVILTEVNPLQAMRAVFVRCAYVLLPLSVVFIRYIPDMGRRYNRAGFMEAIGVTTQKNSLGILVTIAILVLLWDWIERAARRTGRAPFLDQAVLWTMMLIGVYLIYLSDSKTSMLCLGIAGGLLFSFRVPMLRRRVRAFGIYAIIGTLTFFALDAAFGLKETIVVGMGRDMTFTGRTDVWHEILALRTDPLIGTGFCTFWSNPFYLSRLPEWVAFSAHNGYLETYIDGGWIGIFFLGVMLAHIAFRIHARLVVGDTYSVVRLAIFIALIIGNLAESHFARMTPLWFLFLAASLELPNRFLAELTYRTATPKVEPASTPTANLSAR